MTHSSLGLGRVYSDNELFGWTNSGEGLTVRRTSKSFFRQRNERGEEGKKRETIYIYIYTYTVCTKGRNSGSSLCWGGKIGCGIPACTVYHGTSCVLTWL